MLFAAAQGSKSTRWLPLATRFTLASLGLASACDGSADPVAPEVPSAEAKTIAHGAAPTPSAKASTDEAPPQMTVKLIETPSPDPERRGLAVTFEIEAGWHIYWTNPGDSGLATRVRFTPVDGADFSSVAYPLPERFVAPGDIATFGYGHRTALFASVSGVAAGDRVQATASWLVCKESCIKQKAELELTLGESVDTSHEEFRARIPAPLEGDAAPALRSVWTSNARGVGLTVDFGDELPHAFFPNASDPLILDRNELVDTKLELHWRRGAASTPDGPQGVLVFGTPTQPRPFTLALEWPDAAS